MSDNTHISWADATWGVVVGCTRVDKSCDNCYAIRGSHRLEGNPNPKIGPVYSDLTMVREGGKLDWTGVVKCLPERLGIPRAWKKPRRIFVADMGDLFHHNVPFEFIDRVYDIEMTCPQHTFLHLTKRPERMLDYYTEHRPDLGKNPPKNVWLGTSIPLQEFAERRIEPLIHTPAARHFVSAEPLLGPLDLSPWLGRGVDWVIAGGESGPQGKRREMDKAWATALRDQCLQTGGRAAFHFKQSSGARPGMGRELDGKVWDEVPVVVA